MAGRGIKVDFNADVARFTSGIDKATNDLNRFQSNASRVSKNIDASFAKLGRNLFGGIAAAFSVQEVARAADSFQNIQARLKLATRDAEEFAKANENIQRIATSSKSSLESTATLYTRISQSLLDVGGTQKQVADTTQALALSLRLSGATADESASAMLQFSQAIGSGVLRGEEFNAVNEAAPRVMKALADSLGVPVGKLREMAKEGQITRDVLVEALGTQLPKLIKEAETLPNTIGASFTDLRNQLLLTVGELDKYTGASGATANFIGEAGRVALETIVVLGANVAFVFKGVYTEITGIGRQLAALSRLDFKGFSAISDAMKADAAKARKEMDDFSERILNPKKITIPTVTEDSGAAERLKQALLLAEQEAKRKEAAKAAETAAKALANQQNTFIAGLQKEAQNLGATSVQLKLYEAAVLKITGARLESVRANAQRIEDFKREEDALSGMRDSYADAADAYLSFIQKVGQDTKASDEKLDRMRLEISLSEKTESQRNKAIALYDLEIKAEKQLKQLRGLNIDDSMVKIQEEGIARAKTSEQEVIRFQEQIDRQKIAAGNMQKIWDNFGFNFQRNFGDQIFNTLNGNFDNIGSAWKSMLTRMVADWIAAQAQLALFGEKGIGGGLLKGGLSILSSLLGGAKGGGALKIMGGGTTGFAADGAYFDGNVAKFAMGGVVNSPTPFKFASGGTIRNGLMGEAGPEAIMPLKRGPDGKLGVSGGGGVSVNYSPVINIDSRADRTEVHAIVTRAVKQGNADLVEKLGRQGRI